MSVPLRKPPGTQRNVKGRNKTVLFFLRLLIAPIVQDGDISRVLLIVKVNLDF